MPASVHDGARASRIVLHVSQPFAHNEVCALHAALRTLHKGKSIVFVAVALESIYSMDGTVAPLFRAIPDNMGLEAAGWSRCSAGGLRVLPFGKVLAASDGASLFTCQF